MHTQIYETIKWSKNELHDAESLSQRFCCLMFLFDSLLQFLQSWLLNLRNISSLVSLCFLVVVIWFLFIVIVCVFMHLIHPPVCSLYFVVTSGWCFASVRCVQFCYVSSSSLVFPSCALAPDHLVLYLSPQFSTVSPHIVLFVCHCVLLMNSHLVLTLLL